MSSAEAAPPGLRSRAWVPGVVRNIRRRTTWWKVRDLMHRVAALEQRVEADRRSLELIDYVLHTPPYVSHRSAIEVVDDNGATVLGFDGPSQGGDGIYAAFEDVFRGSEEFIRQRQAWYVPHLAGRSSVVDIGCGRGELLDVLTDAQIPCLGVEPDAVAVERAQARGHRVVQTDALSFLVDTPPGSVDAIVSMQFIEHIGYDDLIQFLRLSASRLAPGGVFIAETVNPHSVAGLRTFWLDLTHHKPIFPEALVVLCRAAGFHSGRVVYPFGSGDHELDRRSAGEYALIARIAN